MILEDATFEAFGYYPSTLKLHSSKIHILAACDNCSRVRKTSKNLYRSLCRSCAKKGNRYRLGKAASKETKALISASLIGNKNSLGKILTEKHKLKISTAHKGRTGDKASNWQGGISFEPYCVKFNDEYKEYIRNLFGNECFLCGMSVKENGQALSVHHVNYNKNCGCDETICICVPLCRRCHLKTNGDRDYWQALITEILKSFKAWV